MKVCAQSWVHAVTPDPPPLATQQNVALISEGFGALKRVKPKRGPKRAAFAMEAFQ